MLFRLMIVQLLFVSPGGDKVCRMMKSESIRSDKLLGLTEYYDAVLSGKGLTTKEGEFRTNKLSLILDFLKATNVPENLRTDLISAIIDAWRLKIPERTLTQREEELKMIMKSIKNIRYAAKRIKGSPNTTPGLQIDIVVLSDLPLMPSDLRQEHAPEIYDLLSQARDYHTSLACGVHGFSP